MCGAGGRGVPGACRTGVACRTQDACPAGTALVVPEEGTAPVVPLAALQPTSPQPMSAEAWRQASPIRVDRATLTPFYPSRGGWAGGCVPTPQAPGKGVPTATERFLHLLNYTTKGGVHYRRVGRAFASRQAEGRAVARALVDSHPDASHQAGLRGAARQGLASASTAQQRPRQSVWSCANPNAKRSSKPYAPRESSTSGSGGGV